MKEVKEFWTNVLRNEGTEIKDRLKSSEYIAKTSGAFLDKVDANGGLCNENYINKKQILFCGLDDVHSAVKSELKKQNLIENIRPSDKSEFDAYQGKRVKT